MKLHPVIAESPYQNKQAASFFKKLLRFFHMDIFLLMGLIALSMCGLFILFSAANQNIGLVTQQLIRLALAFFVMIIFAQIPPNSYKNWAPWIFGLGSLLLFAVLVVGLVSKGAQRWINLGLFSFQPSELMKLGMPMMLSWYLSDKRLPPNMKEIAISLALLIVPTLLIAKQPDLGTALMVATAGMFVLLLAGMAWRIMSLGIVGGLLSLPFLWHFLHGYQKDRVLTFFNPERDPLGAGYHIIQSKIAIGSGGFFGKGWLNGTQSHLHFLPEHATDFIFAVCGEELGFIGCTILLIIFASIVARGLYISYRAHDSFTRLLSGSLILTFFMSFFVNIGMVTGVLPVVGLPLPMVSYGGTSMVTLMAGFGIIMSIHTHKKLIST